MKSINEFLNNTGLDDVLLEALSNKKEYTDDEIFESLDILFNESEIELNFNPKTENELFDLLTIKNRDTQKVDEFRVAFWRWLKENREITEDDVDTSGIFYDVWLDVPGSIGVWFDLDTNPNHTEPDWFDKLNLKLIRDHEYGISARGGNLRFDIFKYRKDHKIGDPLELVRTIRSIKYDFETSFFENFVKLVFNVPNEKITRHIINNLGKSTNIDSKYKKIQNEMDQQVAKKEKQVENSINDENEKNNDGLQQKKELLSKLCKSANVTGDQLLNVIKKCSEDRELTEETTFGLSAMICGALTCMRNGGKGDKKSVGALCERILKIVNNPKTGLRYILK